MKLRISKYFFKTTFLLFTIIASLNLSAQNTQDSYFIKGEIKLSIEKELITPIHATIVIDRLNQVAVCDEAGKYEFKGLKSGKYKIKVLGFGYLPFDTTVVMKNMAIDNLNLIVFPDCNVNKEIAQRDIDKKRTRLLLQGGIVPVVYTNQHKFEKKYNVQYYDYGDDGVPAIECIEQYNKVVFDYLSKNYGSSWRKEIRHDVVGYEKNNIEFVKDAIQGAWGEDELGNAIFAFYPDSMYYPDANLWYKYEIAADTILIKKEDNYTEKVLIKDINDKTMKLKYLDYDINETYKKR